MRSKELRLALVLYGGVSLAIYMHGVTREILNLVRASKALQRELQQNDTVPKRRASDKDPEREIDTETIYADLLRMLRPDLDVRVVVDVIAGASAGGVNGIMLARALAHDLPLDAHRELWLKNADVTRLVDDRASSGRFGKIYLTPILYTVLGRRLRTLAPEPETREKLTGFIRSRWFKPPFSGRRYIGWMIDACDDMGPNPNIRGSLIPVGQSLDLFVTVTDFYGHRNRIRLHDPVEIEELEHRRILRFQCERRSDGAMESDFGVDDVPGLVFAARATSSFPGAFPPATVSELDSVLSERGREWIGRPAFLNQVASREEKPAALPFVDGSVVMNKPFAPAIETLLTRPAQREVARRLLYVDPMAGETTETGFRGRPGFFRTILASISRIPRNEPISDDLNQVAEHNRQVRHVGNVIAAAEPDVEALVRDIVGEPDETAPSLDDIATWRKRANNAAATGAGYAYQSYIRLKIRAVLDRFAALTVALGQRGGVAVSPHKLTRSLVEWAEGERIIGGRFATYYGSADDVSRSRKIDFLKVFDADFRTRRLRFVIRRINALYGHVAKSDRDAAAFDQLKSEFYGVVEDLKNCWAPATYGEDTVDAALYIVAGLREGGDHGNVANAVEWLGTEMNLIACDQKVDNIFSHFVLDDMSPEMRHSITTAYIGFAFFDVLTLPMMQWHDLNEFQEILVDRISPIDAAALGGPKSAPKLKCTGLQSFAGFFNRAYREHDYLLGRLNVAERIVDIVIDAGRPGLIDTADAVEVKRRLFQSILDSESHNLTADPELVSHIRERISQISPLDDE